MKKSIGARTLDLYRPDQGIFLAKILGRFIKTLLQNLIWPLMASKDILFLNEKVLRRSHPSPLETWPGHFSGQNTLPVHKNLVAKSDLASNGLQEYFVSQQKSPSVLAPLTSRHFSGQNTWPVNKNIVAKSDSDFVTMFSWTGKIFWPEKCPGQASRGQGCKRWWTLSLRNKISLKAIRGKIRFCDNVFMNWPSSFARKMPWSGL